MARARHQGSVFNRDEGQSLASSYNSWIDMATGPTGKGGESFKVTNIASAMNCKIFFLSNTCMNRFYHGAFYWRLGIESMVVEL
jgi:hypothetical protein